VIFELAQGNARLHLPRVSAKSERIFRSAVGSPPRGKSVAANSSGARSRQKGKERTAEKGGDGGLVGEENEMEGRGTHTSTGFRGRSRGRCRGSVRRPRRRPRPRPRPRPRARGRPGSGRAIG
jgi:hypothetical protein